MLEEMIGRLGNDVAELAYKLSFLEEEIAKLNAHVIDIKEKERENA
tara:strand:- start:1222 stop:1359 length:138 start_codon:yes stop_codon:yes gene_type:complete